MDKMRRRAVVFMDVVEYTRLMARDEVGTHSRFLCIKDTVISPISTTHEGSIKRVMGDSVLIEFDAADGAVDFAVDFQKAMHEYNGDKPREEQMNFRVGANIGPTIDDEHGAIGTSVNIASRLQDIAPVGGICMTEFLLDEVGGHQAEHFEFAGNQKLKNIDAPVSVWSWVHATGSSDHLISRPYSEVTKPGIAVFPFDYLADDETYKYLVDGLAEDLITRLAYSPVLRVIGRNSSFAFAQTPRNIKKASEALNANYFIEGSVRKAGDRIKINLRLISAEGEEQVSAHVYNEPLSDIHNIMENVVEEIARAVDPAVTTQELHKSVRKQPQSMDAWDHYLQGKAALNRYNRHQNATAKEHFQKAIQMEEDFSLSHAGLSQCHFANAYLGWTDEREKTFREAYKCASRAIEIDANDVHGHTELVYSGLMTGNYNRAYEAGKKSLELNPFSSDAHFNNGLAELYTGDVDLAIRYINNARAYSPADPLIWMINTALGLSYFVAGDFTNALRVGKLSGESPHGLVNSNFLTAISNVGLGQLDRAKKAAKNLTKLTPVQKINLIDNMPFREETRRNKILDALDKVGW